MSKLKDHREIGRELDLFSFHDIAPGAVFWHRKGYVVYRTLIDFLRKTLQKEGYGEISTPVMVRYDLFKRSGHWNYYKENVFNLNLEVYSKEEIDGIDKILKSSEETNRIILDLEKNTTGIPLMKGFSKIWKVKFGNKDYDVILTATKTSEKDYVFHREFIANYSLKPMNCPEAALVFSSKTRSYQELPLRFLEFGILHRNELTGVLGGLFRVRQFTIDDVHHFIRPDQIQEEIRKIILLVVDFYKLLGFKPQFYLSTKPDKAMGNPDLWEKAEQGLKTALEKSKVQFAIKAKDGAFYGPKIDIHIQDSQRRDWQLATIQLDFQIPESMKLEYRDSSGGLNRPVMIHQAILGSLERFIGILTEHFQGAFPLWLSPVQVEVLSVSDKHNVMAKKVHEELLNAGIRSELNAENKMLGAKIRESTLQKVPYMIIIGDKETAVKPLSVSVRTREGKDLEMQKLTDFVQLIKSHIEKNQ